MESKLSVLYYRNTSKTAVMPWRIYTYAILHSFYKATSSRRVRVRRKVTNINNEREVSLCAKDVGSNTIQTIKLRELNKNLLAVQEANKSNTLQLDCFLVPHINNLRNNDGYPG